LLYTLSLDCGFNMASETKKTSHRIDLKKNNRPLIFLVCLIIATALWMIKALEKNYDTTVSLSVSYVNIPNNNVLVNPPPSKLDVKIRSMGFNLLRHKIGLTLTPINLDVKPFVPAGNGGRLPKFTILSDAFIPQISEQISQSISVLDVSPDSLFFHYDYLTEKKVRVISTIKIDCQNQFFVSDSIKISPAYVNVRGPVSIIDTLSGIYTTTLKFDNVTASVHSIISLEKIKQLEYSVNKVSIEMPVSQFTEYNEKIIVKTFNVPDNMSLITFPGKVDISCLIAFDKFKTLSAEDFTIGVDYIDISSSSNTLPIKITRKPDFIKSLKIYPLQVEYIIKRK
jgi:hypothetical protein